MTSPLSRRAFLCTGAMAAAATSLGSGVAASGAGAEGPAATPGEAPEPAESKPAANAPVVIASANGLAAVTRAADAIGRGEDTLDAVIAGVNLVEEDPDDHSVGYGGLPNEDGVVELDSCVMHGPTHRCGAVAALRNIKTPSRVAKLVMERTDHVLIVGEGALRFARAHGFTETNLLTEAARKIWLEWKEKHSDLDDWIAPAEVPDEPGAQTQYDVPFTYGTINCCGLNAKGELSGVTTTSGLSYKIPGRVGDSPIIGAGLYVDNEVGAAGSTGRGEAVIRTGGARTVIEAMRHGRAPTDACLDALRYIVSHTFVPRLKRKDGRPNFNVFFYAVAKDGRYGAASMWSGGQFSIHESGKSRREDAAYLFERPNRPTGD
jgi:N4-(beta-N-acetylglucosaminyl)-L-asparaginase